MTPKPSPPLSPPNSQNYGEKLTPETTSNGDFRQLGFITTAAAEQMWIERSRRDPIAFIEYITEKAPARHHIEWIRRIFDPSAKRVLIVAPRESAKTTILVHIMAWMIGKAPWSTNFIGSVNDDQTKERLRVIKELIEYNPRYRNVFPWVHIDNTQPNTVHQFTVWSEKWTEDQPGSMSHRMWRSLVTRYADPRNPTLFAAGSGSGAVIGKRFNGLALIDDPHDHKNSATEDQRDKYELWFDGTFLPCVQETGKVVMITTRWAETDIAARLRERVNEFNQKIWVYLEQVALVSLPDGTEASYWPEFWPLKKLKAKRLDVGEVIWQLMYMNNPLGMATGEFKIDMLRRDLPNPMPELKDIVISLDLAATEQTYSDYSILAAIARDKQKPENIYVLQVLRGKWGFTEVFKQIAQLADQIYDEYGRLDGILFEKQSFQTAWAKALSDLRPDLPIKVVPIKGDKESRLKAVALKAQSSRLFINQSMPTLAILQSELIAFPKAQHDDIPDALSLPFQYWGVTHKSAGLRLVKSPYLL